MNDFYKFLEEENIDLEVLNAYIDSEEFIKLAGPVVDFGNDNYKVLKSSIDGDGVFANKDFEKGDIIGYGLEQSCRTLAGRYTNHSKNNNAKFYYFKDNDNIVLVSEGSIKIDEEIVVNYRHHTHNKEYIENEIKRNKTKNNRSRS